MRRLIGLIASIVFFAFTGPTAAGSDTAFTYQGHLTDNGQDANGTYNLVVRLFGQESDGAQLVPEITIDDVPVTEGVFTIELDYGADVFDNESRWLQIEVSEVVLTPRQPVNRSPYAIQTRGIFVDESHKVGIGTTSPQVAMHIALNTGEGLPPSIVPGTLLLAQTNNADNWAHMGILSGRFGRAQLNFGDADNDRQGAISYNNPADRLDIQVNAATQMSIDSSGKVGIGTTSPQAALHIAGSTGEGLPPSIAAGTMLLAQTNNADNWARMGILSGRFGRAELNFGDADNDRQGAISFNNPAERLDIQVNEATLMSIDSSGKVGIGTTSPQAALHIAETTGEGLPPSIAPGTMLLAQTNNADNWAHMGILSSRLGRAQLNFGDADNDRQGAISYNNPADTLDFQVNAATQMTIDSSGNVGIGTTSPEAQLDVNGAVRIDTSGAGATILELAIDRRWEFRQLGSDAATALELVSLDSQGISNKDFIINTTGEVGIGTPTPGFTLEVNGSAGKPGGGSWSNTSDLRLKKHIQNLEGTLDRMLALHGVTFEYKDADAINELHGTRIGMIAQEVEEVFPDWVGEDVHGHKTLTYRGFEALTVEAMRELSTEHDAEIADLRQQVDDLRDLVVELTSTISEENKL